MKKVSPNYYLRAKRLNSFQDSFAKRGKKLFLSYFLPFSVLLFLFAGMVHGAEVDEIRTGGEENIPSTLTGMDCQEESYAILVEKQTQRVFLYGCVAGKITLIKSFPCTTGENIGDKKKRGDRKTPEGIYFSTQVLEDEELEPRYGVKAFVLDYPNFFDRMQRKGGRGIWLHGTDKALIPNDSRGCIALNNKDLLDLLNYISLYRTPIIILEKIEYLPVEVVEKKKRRLEAFIIEWLNSWEDKELSGYTSCYAKDFRSKGMNWEQWKQYKDNLNKRNDRINITLSGIQGFNHNNYDLVTFRQDYHSAVLKSEGIKKLYLREDGEAFKIIREQWNPLRGGYLLSRKKSSAQTVALKKQDSSKGEVERIKAFIGRWRTYWQNKEIEDYIRCYADDFKAGGMDKQEWKKHKRVLSERYKTIKVMVENAEIDIKGEKKEAEVSFLQRFKSDRYSDKGLKTLLLRKEEGAWYIVSEKWKPL